jgi:branched-chain amino acid transport system permease protein
MMVVSIFIAVSLYVLLYRTRLGSAVRAGVDDRETVQAIGINITVIYTAVFVLSAFLGGIAGVLGGSYLQLSPGGDAIILIYSLVVIILGGMGSLGGTVVSSLILGQVISFGLAYVPQYSYFLIFIPMALVLAIRPQGLFGRKL